MQPWTWNARLWKSRLPLVALPLLVGLRALAELRKTWGVPQGSLPVFAEVTLLCLIAGVTGFLQLPFSVTWWFVLVAACFLETELVLGVATVLSLSVLLGWYGIRVLHPHAADSIWGGARDAAGKGGITKEVMFLISLLHLVPCCLFKSLLDRKCSQEAWDLMVHFLPAVAMLYWFGPFVSADGSYGPGIVTAAAACTALPLNVVWLWSLGLGQALRRGESPVARLWPVGMQLSGTDAVYRIRPPLPASAWHWLYGAHWGACACWAACLVLPKDVLIAYSIVAFAGLVWMPFTNAWWAMWLLAMSTDAVGTTFRGIVACCAATMAVGWYGTRVLVPTAMKSLVKAWAVDPIRRLLPPALSARMRNLEDRPAVMIAARCGDLCLHAIPATTAIVLFAREVTASAALAALPSNLLYLAATRSKSLADTNRIYGVSPEPPQYVWKFIYGSHVAVCSAVLLALSLRQDASGAAAMVPGAAPAS